MKKVINFLITTLLITLFSFLLSSCIENKTINLKTYVLNNLQIDINYKQNTVINSPSYVISKNQEFLGWYINNEKVNFPYTLTKDIVFIAKIKVDNENNQTEPSTPNTNNSNSNSIHTIGSLSTDFNGYYKNITATTGKDLFLQLSELLNTYPVSKNTTYNQVTSVIVEADVRPEVSERYISGIYGYYFEKRKDGSLIRNLSPDSNEKTFNREHVWPQSRLGISKGEKAQGGRSNIASDAHNLRASGKNINALRSSLDFVDGSGRAQIASGGFYPGDMSKGDVARILLYMAVRYKEQLKLTARRIETGYDQYPGYMGNLSLFNKWNNEDMPDQLEKKRNDVIFRHQKNRNPFIDHPEWVKPIWDYLMSIDR